MESVVEDIRKELIQIREVLDYYATFRIGYDTGDGRYILQGLDFETSGVYDSRYAKSALRDIDKLLKKLGRV